MPGMLTIAVYIAAWVVYIVKHAHLALLPAQ